MDISIVVTTYKKHLKNLNSCLKSIKISKLKYEIIVINSTKTKKSKSYIYKILKQNNFETKSKVIELQNKNISYARNSALKFSHGNLITFIDGDDKLIKNFIFNQRIIKKKYDVAVFNVQINKKYKIKPCSFYGFKGHLNQFQIKKLIEKYLNLPRGNSIVTHVWSKIYSKKFLKNNNIKFKNEIKINEDFLFNSLVFIKAKKMLLNYSKKMIEHNPSSIKTNARRHLLNDKNYIRPIKNLSKIFKQKKSFKLETIARKYWKVKLKKWFLASKK